MEEAEEGVGEDENDEDGDHGKRKRSILMVQQQMKKKQRMWYYFYRGIYLDDQAECNDLHREMSERMSNSAAQ